MLPKRFRLSNMPTPIRKNTDFPLQKPGQLLSAEVNFKGCFGTISMGLHGVGATAWMI